MADISYDPGIAYHGDAYTYQGLSNLGQGLGSFLQNQQKHAEEVAALQAQDAKNQVILNHAANTVNPMTGQPYLSQDDIATYMKGNAKQRQAVAEGLAANITTDTAMRNQQILNQLHQAGAYQSAAAGGLDLAKSNLINKPRPVPPLQGGPIPGAPGVTAITGGGLTKPVIQQTDQNANQPIMLNGTEIGKYDGKGEPHFYPQQAMTGPDGPIPLDPVIDPNTGKRVQGKAINRKTGAEVDTSGENPTVVTLDPSGRFYLDNKSKSWKPIPATTMMMPDSSQPTPTPTPSSIIFGGMNSPAAVAAATRLGIAPPPTPTPATSRSGEPMPSPSPTPAGASGPVPVTTQEQYNALPNGATYLDTRTNQVKVKGG